MASPKYILIKEYDLEYGANDPVDPHSISNLVGKTFKVVKESRSGSDWVFEDGVSDKDNDIWFWKKSCCVEITEEQFNNENLRNFWYECYRIRS